MLKNIYFLLIIINNNIINNSQNNNNNKILMFAIVFSICFIKGDNTEMLMSYDNAIHYCGMKIQ